MRIEGILLPSDWDDNGRVTAMVLATSDEAEFKIKSRQASMRFEKYLRQNVIIEGELAGASLVKISAIKRCHTGS